MIIDDPCGAIIDDCHAKADEIDRLKAQVARLKRVAVAASAVDFDDDEYDQAIEDCEKHGDLTFTEAVTA